jgi:hypothetical protein
MITRHHLALGRVFHLDTDLCTQKGLRPFFPFSDTRVHGSIRPCNRYDNRIFRFCVQHGTIRFIVLIIQGEALLQAKSGTILCIAGTGACIVSMFFLSAIRIESGPGTSTGTREAAEA